MNNDLPLSSIRATRPASGKRSCAEESSVFNFKAMEMSKRYLESTLRKDSLTNRFLGAGFDNRSDKINCL